MLKNFVSKDFVENLRSNLYKFDIVSDVGLRGNNYCYNPGHKNFSSSDYGSCCIVSRSFANLGPEKQLYDDANTTECAEYYS